MVYTNLYRAAGGEDRTIGAIARSDLTEAVTEFGVDKIGEGGIILTTIDQAKQMMAKMGIGDGGEDLVAIAAKGDPDSVYQHDSAAATVQIAKRIIDLSTDKSLTPDSPSPTAQIIKAAQLAGASPFIGRE